MRIITGKYGGRKIYPPSRMPYTRPTTDVAKEGLFNIIENNSALSKEIFKYFTSVSFKKLPAGCNYSEEIAKHPSHYFSHIFAADSCE